MIVLWATHAIILLVRPFPVLLARVEWKSAWLTLLHSAPLLGSEDLEAPEQSLLCIWLQ